MSTGATHRRAGALAVVVGVAVVAGVAVLAGCAATPETGGDDAAPEAPGADTLAGEVEVVGSDPGAFVVIRTVDGQIPVAGSHSEPMRNLGGVQVEAVGARGEYAFRVDHFRVTGATGLPAADGILELLGDTAVLVTRSHDRIRFSPAPPSFREYAGRWIWIAGHPGGEAQVWGIISESASWR